MNRPKILVVDDHPANRKLVTFILETRGFDVVCATDADEARSSLDREIPSLVLMDVQLPRVDGLTLTRELRTELRFQRLPIVAVTAYAMASDEQAALDAGCSAFVSKPINARALGELVVRLLQEGTP